jgi:hypothetical protein
MYPLSGPPNKAPLVRIRLMTAALSNRVHTEQITGGRFGRFGRALRWLASGGPRRVRAVYVEAPTTNAMPTDLLFLALMRLLRRPVGVYFRDAYQLHRDVYPRTSPRQIVTDWLWRITTPVLRGIANERFVQSPGMGRALGLKRPIMLPPGTDTAVPNLGAGPATRVVYVGSAGPADGLVVIGRALSPERLAVLPPYVEFHQASRDELPDLLADARACVIPRRISAYASMVLPVKMWDYLSFGKPIVATSPTEADQILCQSGAAVLTSDTPEGLAEVLRALRVVAD